VSNSLLARGAFALALGMAGTVHAASDADLAAIRDEIRALKESYEARIRALEERLKSVEGAAPAIPTAAAATEPSSAYSPSMLAAFNPGIAVVCRANYQNLKQDPAQYAFNNIQLGEDVARAGAASGSVSRKSASSPASTICSRAA
jgi:hypothetical protein